MRAKTLMFGTVLLALVLGLLPLGGAFAQGSEPLKIQLSIGDVGFECLQGCQAVKFGGDKWNYTIEVEQGRQVEIAFKWAHVGYTHDEHIFVLDGYKLEWEKIGQEHKEAKLQFIADKPGTFQLKCDIECEVHDYAQRGWLKVTRGGSGGAAVALTPTKLTLTPSALVTVGGDPVLITGILTDGKGNPVPKAEVRFSIDTLFGGQKGPMEIRVAKTDANGIVFLNYTPTGPGIPPEGEQYVAGDIGRHVITAQFPGMGLFDEAKQVVEIQGLGGLAPAHEERPTGLERMRGWGQVGLAVLILSIWSVFAFVLFQAVGVSWSKGKKSKGAA